MNSHLTSRLLEPEFEGDKVEEVEDPPIPSSEGDTRHLSVTPALSRGLPSFTAIFMTKNADPGSSPG